jgi:hypothetical protein
VTDRPWRAPALGLLLAAWPCTLRPQGPGALGAEFQVNTYTTGVQYAPSVAVSPSGSFVVAWQSFQQDAQGFGVFAQRFDAAGVAQGAEFRVNTTTTLFQGEPSAAMDQSGNFVIAWASLGQDGSSYGIFAQRYDAAGAAQGAEFRVNTTTSDSQGFPSVAMDASGGFVVAWASFNQDGSGYGVFAQRFDAGGVAQGAEFRVNTYTTSDQRRPSVAMNTGGSFAVVWESSGQDGSSTGVFAQRYDAAGAAQGAEFRVNTQTVSVQSNPSVAMDSSGGFVVAWDDFGGQDGDGAGIFAQKYDGTGSAVGVEFQVNTYTPSSQSYPSVASDPAGGFVVAWTSYAQDGSSDGVFAQRFDAGGSRVGPEFQVNTTSYAYQSNPKAAMDAMGRFIVAWDGTGPEDGEGIFAQRYDLSQALSIGDVTVAEGNSGTSPASFSVTLSPPSPFTVTVPYATADGTATDGSDYLATAGTLTFDPGITTQTIDVTIIGDAVDETSAGGPSETFFVNLGAPTNARIGDGQAQGTILNDDAAPGAPALDPPPGGVITVGATQTLTGANFTAGTVIKLFVNTGDSIDDVSGSGGFTPAAFSFGTLTWDVPATVPLGEGFGSIFVVNTDQGFTVSNTQYALLYGDAPDNLPTITAINGTSLATSLDPGIPVAHADTVVAPSSTVTLAGTGFNIPGVNLFAAPDVGADPAPTATPCPVANYGPFFLGGTSTSLQVDIPAVPAGPANFQVVNTPFTGNVQSNSVSAVMGAQPTITAVNVDSPTPGMVQVIGAGFSCLSVINLFNLQGASVVNLGGLTGGGERVIPLQFVSASELRFARPAGAVAGPAFVEVLNPPYIPFSSSGNDPDGAFSFP